MAKIIFHDNGYGLGDVLMCFKSLYAIKQLYPQYKLVFYYHWGSMQDDFMKKLGLVDETIDARHTNLEELCAMKPEIFITTHRKGSFFKYLKRLNFKKIIAQPHFISLISRAFTTPLPHFKSSQYISDIYLQLVRMINTKHYDENIHKIDFSKIKELLPKEMALNEAFFKKVDFAYKKVIAINAFSNSKEYHGFNFFTKDWVNLAFELGRVYPEFLFILLNFQKNPIQFNINQTQNVRVFINNDSIASLVGMTLNLDYLISIDTANVHLCNLLQVPNLVFIDKKSASKWGGGILLNTFTANFGWQKNYQKTLKAFTQEVKQRLNLLH